MNLNGFLGAQHYETSCIPLFDEKGSEKGRIKFEHKKIGIQGIQTADIFLPSSDEDKGIVKDEI